MEHFELVVLLLLVAVAGLALLARLARVPYPIFLVLGGLVLGFVPGVPEIELPPELVLLIFLPPLLYAAAFFSSLRDLRQNVRPISLLAIGLVGRTTRTGPPPFNASSTRSSAPSAPSSCACVTKAS